MHRVLTHQRLHQASLLLRTSTTTIAHQALLARSNTVLQGFYYHLHLHQQQHRQISILARIRRALTPSSSSTTTTTSSSTTSPKAASTPNTPQPAETNRSHNDDKEGLFSQAQAATHDSIVYPVYAYSTSVGNYGAGDFAARGGGGDTETGTETERERETEGYRALLWTKGGVLGSVRRGDSEIIGTTGDTAGESTAERVTGEKKTTTMASDEDYAAFLERANQPASGVQQASATNKGGGFTVKTVDTHEPVPAVLSEVESVYVSEADEEFVPVSLGWEGKGKSGKVDVASFASLISQEASAVTSMSAKEFDPRNQYSDVIEAVKKAGTTGKVEVFRVELHGARCEYWVVSVDEKGGRIVGLKVGAVES